MTIFLILAATLGASALLIGSLGAHLWQDLLTDPDTLGRFHRAENYLFCLAVGVIVFSGSLLVYSVTGFQPIIKITPLGGSLLILGWILLGIRSWQMYRWHRNR